MSARLDGGPMDLGRWRTVRKLGRGATGARYEVELAPTPPTGSGVGGGLATRRRVGAPSAPSGPFWAEVGGEGLDPAGQSRFRERANAWRDVPGAWRVEDLGIDAQGRPYLVTWAPSAGPPPRLGLPGPDLLELARDLAETLERAHHVGIAHGGLRRESLARSLGEGEEGGPPRWTVAPPDLLAGPEDFASRAAQDVADWGRLLGETAQNGATPPGLADLVDFALGTTRRRPSARELVVGAARLFPANARDWEATTGLGGEVRIVPPGPDWRGLLRDGPPPSEDQCLSLDELSGALLGTDLAFDAQGVALVRLGAGHEQRIVVPVLTVGPVAWVGAWFRVGRVPDVAGLVAEERPDAIHARWEWPERARSATVALRRDRFAARPEEGTIQVPIDRHHQYANAGGLRTKRTGWPRTFLTVFASEGDRFASGQSPGARLVLNRRRFVYWWVDPLDDQGGAYRLSLRSPEGGTVPELALTLAPDLQGGPAPRPIVLGRSRGAAIQWDFKAPSWRWRPRLRVADRQEDELVTLVREGDDAHDRAFPAFVPGLVDEELDR